jgi:nucleoside-diphosphate-sugar epimerase
MITVYGGNGFIGSFFCEIIPSYRMQRNEICPPQGTKTIVYFISTVDNYNVFTNPYIDIETNLTHLIRVLECCKDKNIDFIFISSWFVYGNTKIPAKEDSPCNPKGFYSITKRAAEQLLESYSKTFGMKYKIIRLGNVIGNMDKKVSKKKNALQYLISELKEGNDISLYNNGNFYRDFIHVEDVVSGIQTIMKKGRDRDIYNLSTGGNPILFREIIEYIKMKLKNKSKIKNMESTDFHKIVQVESMILDTTKIKQLGFKPKYTIFEAINKIL